MFFFFWVVRVCVVMILRFGAFGVIWFICGKRVF